MIWLKKSALDYIVDSSLSPLSCLVVVEKIEKHRDEKWTIKGTQACAFISSQRSLQGHFRRRRRRRALRRRCPFFV